MSPVIRSTNGTQAAVFGTIEKVAMVERHRLFGPEPEPIEVQVARYQAGEEARRVVAEAFELSDSIRAEAYRSGYDSGWAAGYAAGKSEAEAQVQAEAALYRAQYRAEFEQILRTVEEQSREQWLDAEAQIVAFALEVARKVVKHEAAVNPDVVIAVVKNALRRHVISGEGETVRIRVNAADLDNVRTAREDILTVIDSLRNVEIIEDRRVSQGGCVVETASGTIDASVETQFRSIEETLHVVREQVEAERGVGGVSGVGAVEGDGEWSADEVAA